MRTILKFDKEDKVGKKLFHPEDRFITQWNKTFLLCSLVALSLDPVFLYIPIIHGKKKCLDMDQTLAIVVCVLRSFADILYIFHIIIMFRTMCVTPSNFKFGRGEYIDKPRYVAKHYLKSYFIMDILAALPLPQTSLFYQKVTKTSSFGIENAWARAAFNFFLYVLASHVVEALWYLFAIESELRCWRMACKRHKCNSNYLYCGKDHVTNYGFLKTSCPLLERNDIKDSTNFDFGIFLDALQTRILETRDFRQKILYCSLWGLQSLSSLGQGLKASTFYGEILFVDFVAVIGLVLFALLIGNMQKYLQSLSNLTRKMEEMKEKWQEAEDLMSHMSLPEALRQQVRRDKQDNWKLTLGVELDTFF
ncbi:putative Ion transport domain-containing protein [Helianthus annuus]|nr:putative Ion transport domain-containing protein [Helianthus annuus]